MVTLTGRGIAYYLKYLVLVEPQIISKKKHTKRYCKKQTSSNLNTNQLNSQKNTEMPLTSTFIQSGSLPVISYIYITPLIGVKKKSETHLFAAIFRGPKKTPVINCLFYNNLFKIHLGSCPTSRGRVFSRWWFFTNPFEKYNMIVKLDHFSRGGNSKNI